MCRWPELSQPSVLGKGWVGVSSVQVGLLSTPLPGLRQDSVLARSNGLGEAGAHLSSGFSVQKGWRVPAFL